jgi:excisionase family DNA binding protein
MMDLDLFDNQYLTVYEVARVMKVSVKTVYDWCSKGYIPCLKLGRLVRIDKDDFMTRLDEIKRQSRHKGRSL